MRKSAPLSHKNFGWEKFTEEVLKYLDKKARCFLLWGEKAQKKEMWLKNPKHYILKASHPSPLSFYRGFRGCNHFNLANRWLKKEKKKSILWKEL